MHALRYLTLIWPGLPWLWLRGKCSACGAAISARYPLVEIASGLLGAYATWRYGPTLLAALMARIAEAIAYGIERLATEVRHLQRSEVREAEEFFHAGQKGSSTMPHKRNPVLSENLTGLARLEIGRAHV